VVKDPEEPVGGDRETAATSPESSKPIPPSEENFPVVGIGASAGGLEAMEQLLQAMPEDPGVALVLVLHLDPNRASLLPELLQRQTMLPVRQIEDGMPVERNQVYIIPPNRTLKIFNGTLQLFELASPRTWHPVDDFFDSLAEDQGENAIAIVLSGTGSDGSDGIRSIKSALGLVIAQSESSASYDGMPRSAIATGLVDYVLSPDAIPERLIEYLDHDPLNEGAEIVENELQKAFSILRSQTGNDFSLYKRNTIVRRVERRMTVHQLEELRDYVRYLQTSGRETRILFKDLLIGVTSFFRDPEAFDLLETRLLPDLLSQLGPDSSFRAWVPACSTGEEAYSLAIAIQDAMQAAGRQCYVQIFGTDLDEDSIAVARAGIYPASIASAVGERRLREYFSEEEDGRFRVQKKIREMLVFAPQNIIKDPPFTKLDLISCRNLLIYFGAKLQVRLLPMFHYSLKPGGLLFLGSSESIGRMTDLFSAESQKSKIFRRLSTVGPRHETFDLSARTEVDKVRGIDPPLSVERAQAFSPLQLIEAVLKQSGLPPSAIVDGAGDVVYIHGRTGKYLEPPQGRASLNVLEMARPGLKAGLAAAFRSATVNRQEAASAGLLVEQGGRNWPVDLTVRPIVDQPTLHGLYAVIFEASEVLPDGKDSSSGEWNSEDAAKNADELKVELAQTRETLQTMIEELETSNEELKSTNEELQSTNEELQSSNEELETSKEELQSLNEESVTVNTELQGRIDDLSQASDDLNNLLNSTEIATLFLDMDLRVRRFTPTVRQIIPLAVSDVGRPVQDLASALADVDLVGISSEVLTDLALREVEAVNREGQVYRIRVRPYRTTANVIDGVVLTFEDVTRYKMASESLRSADELYRALFDRVDRSAVLLDPESGRVLEFNRMAHEGLGYSREEFEKLLSAEALGSESKLVPIDISNLYRKKVGEGFTAEHRDRAGDLQGVSGQLEKIVLAGRELLLATWQRPA